MSTIKINQPNAQIRTQIIGDGNTISDAKSGTSIGATPDAINIGDSHRQIRNDIKKICRVDSEFDGFVLDNFPSVYRLFSNGMDRERKMNLLLEKEEILHIRVALAQFDHSGKQRGKL